MGKVKMTGNQFFSAADRLYNKIKHRGVKFKNVYGIPKGGLPLAVYMANHFDLELILDLDKVSKKTLVCDEICETGKTVTRLGLTENFVATIHYKPNSVFEPTVWVLLKRDRWIVYPWERK